MFARGDWSVNQVYPRPHGEAVATQAIEVGADGLSPPTRGSRGDRVVGAVRPRSIPAHAGKPSTPGVGAAAIWVYPRPRGEAFHAWRRRSSDMGLSPPTRGSPSRPSQNTPGTRSIPAHAGKPPGARRVARRRVGGRRRRRGGSIPAHAGKPCSGPSPASGSRVYPRPRGEATMSARIGARGTGLSPPTRGSLVDLPLGGLGTRSIPAHAGKPGCAGRILHGHEVYPRPRGEADGAVELRVVAPGLSPPTRGSRRPPWPGPWVEGSIPAHAGKPG